MCVWFDDWMCGNVWKIIESMWMIELVWILKMYLCERMVRIFKHLSAMIFFHAIIIHDLNLKIEFFIWYLVIKDDKRDCGDLKPVLPAAIF